MHIECCDMCDGPLEEPVFITRDGRRRCGTCGLNVYRNSLAYQRVQDAQKCKLCRRPRDNHKSHESLCPICLYEQSIEGKPYEIRYNG